MFCLHTISAPCDQRSEVLEHPTLELQVVVSHHMGSGDQTLVLGKSNKVLSHHSSPYNLFLNSNFQF